MNILHFRNCSCSEWEQEHWGCLLGDYVPCIYGMPGEVIVGDSDLCCCCVPVQCVTSIVREQLLPIACWLYRSSLGPILFQMSVHTMPIVFTVKIVRLKAHKICCQSNDLDFHSREQPRHTRGNVVLVLYQIIALQTKFGMTLDVYMAYILRHMSMVLTLMEGHSGSAEEHIQRRIILAKQASNKH